MITLRRVTTPQLVASHFGRPWLGDVM